MIASADETCNNRGAFASDELWRKRTHACVVVMTSLVCYADAELDWFGELRLPNPPLLRRTNQGSLLATNAESAPAKEISGIEPIGVAGIATTAEPEALETWAVTRIGAGSTWVWASACSSSRHCH
jgi:hypothetical protein